MISEQKQFALANGESLTLRPVTGDDEEFLLTVYAGTRAEEMAQVEWPEENKQAFLRWQFEQQRNEYQARYPDAEYYVIVIGDHQAGRIWIGADDVEIRLMDIALLPEFQNRGTGTCLVRWLIDRSKTEGKALRHMVFVMNNDAHRFYERLGFVIFEEFGAYKHMEYKQAVGNQ